MKNKVLGKTFSVLEEVAGYGGPMSLKMISERAGISLSTASRIANDLVEAGYLNKTNYREFEPALGLIYLGQRAMLNCYLPKKVNRLIRARCRMTRLNGSLAGVFRNRLVYLYISSHDTNPEKAGMPFVNYPHSSNTALVVLARKYGSKKALGIIRNSMRLHSTERFPKRSIEYFSSRMKQLEKEGYSALIEKNSWNVCMPICWGNEIYGLSVFGSPSAALSMENLVREAKYLSARINEFLQDRDTGASPHPVPED